MTNHEEHEDREGHEGSSSHGLRIPSPLSPEADLVMSQTIGCAIAVHRALGPGFIESIYRKAMCIELESRNLAYEKERSIRVTYRGVEIPGQRVDFIVENCLVVEIKCVERVLPVHRAQLLSYLRLSGHKLGLLLNFNVPHMRQGIHRVINGPESEL